jgi:hypothetical protein
MAHAVLPTANEFYDYDDCDLKQGQGQNSAVYNWPSNKRMQKVSSKDTK